MSKERVSDRDNSVISSCTQCENFLESSIGIGQCLHIVGPNKFKIPVYQYFKPKGYAVPIPDSCPLDFYEDQTIDSNGIGSIASGNNMTDTTQVPKYSNFNEWAKAQESVMGKDLGVSFHVVKDLFIRENTNPFDIEKELGNRLNRGSDMNGAKCEFTASDGLRYTGVVKANNDKYNSYVSVSFPDKQELSDSSKDRYSRLLGISLNHMDQSNGDSNNSELEINELGGKQSKLKERFDYLPPNAVSSCARTIGYGESKYGEGNWKKISILSHINHALAHLFKYLAKDKSEDHLSHAASRLLFALELQLGQKNDN